MFPAQTPGSDGEASAESAQDRVSSTDEGLTSLISRLGDNDGMVREKARHTLVEMGSPAVPALIELLGSNVKRTRWEAARALAGIGDPDSTRALLGLFSDEESDIRWIAARGLIKIGPISLSAVITELLDKPDSKRVRRCTHHVISELGSENATLKEIIDPLRQTLGEMAPTEIIVPRAEALLKEIASHKFRPREKW